MKHYIKTPDERWIWTDEGWVFAKRIPKARLYEEIVRAMHIDSRGYGEWTDIDDLKKRFPELAAQIGGNGSNLFTRGPIGAAFATIKICKNGMVVKRKACGFNYDGAPNQSINRKIYEAIKRRPCVMTGTTQVEVDHREGAKINERIKNTASQSIGDFQPLSPTINKIKREHCRKCQETQLRFDATTLGLPVGWIHGDHKYRGKCYGCFWAGPDIFYKCLAFDKTKSDAVAIEVLKSYDRKGETTEMDLTTQTN